MKPILMFVLCFVVAEGFAQTDAVYMETKKDENNLQFMVYNTTNNPVEVELVLYDVENLRGSKRAATSTIPANGKAMVKELKIKGEYSYGYELSKYYSKKTLASKERKVENVNLEEGIVVFNKTECPRCQFLVHYLMKNDIDFQLMDLDNRKNKKFMYQLLEESGVYEKRVMTPIVVVNDEISYSHENLEEFANSLK